MIQSVKYNTRLKFLDVIFLKTNYIPAFACFKDPKNFAYLFNWRFAVCSSPASASWSRRQNVPGPREIRRWKVYRTFKGFGSCLLSHFFRGHKWELEELLSTEKAEEDKFDQKDGSLQTRRKRSSNVMQPNESKGTGTERRICVCPGCF